MTKKNITHLKALSKKLYQLSTTTQSKQAYKYQRPKRNLLSSSLGTQRNKDRRPKTL